MLKKKKTNAIIDKEQKITSHLANQQVICRSVKDLKNNGYPEFHLKNNVIRHNINLGSRLYFT